MWSSLLRWFLSRVNIKLTFGAVIAIALVGFVYVWHYRPLTAQKNEIAKQREELLQKKKILEDLIKKLEALKDEQAAKIFEEKYKALKKELNATQYDKSDIDLSPGAHTLVLP